MIKLNLGCGGKILPSSEGWVNIDIRDLPGVDIVMDLEKCKFPYENNSIDHVMLQDAFEHLYRAIHEEFLEELFRILKPLGTIYFQMPDLCVAAKRYLDILENPSELQHALTSEQFADILYGGYDYSANVHKWGYDVYSLTKLLDKARFIVWIIGSDGGCNLLCHAIKPLPDIPDKVYLGVSGGLGDVVQVYLANPISPGEPGSSKNFPSTDAITSMWFRRLKSFKAMYPDSHVKVVSASHNPYTPELFEQNPFIDSVDVVKWTSAYDPNMWREDYKGYTSLTSNISYVGFKPEDTPVIYMNDKENKFLDAIVGRGEYIVIHPFAGSGKRVVKPLGFYVDIAKRLSKIGYNIFFVGKGYTQNMDNGGTFIEEFEYNKKGIYSLVGKTSVRFSVNLVMSAGGFIGTHSSMILPAWYKGIKSVCLVPPTNDAGVKWQDFFKTFNPCTWGADKPFNKTIIIDEDCLYNDNNLIKDIVGEFGEI